MYASGMGVTFNSVFEMEFAQHLTKIGVDWEYEPDSFVWYPKPKTYTPDFKINLPNGKSFYIETKGFFYKAARDKMERVHEMHPNVDIRYVFMRATNKLSAKAKKRPTTYAMWCERRGLKWAEKEFPIEWRKDAEEKKVEEDKSKSTKRKKCLRESDDGVRPRGKAGHTGRRVRRSNRSSKPSTQK